LAPVGQTSNHSYGLFWALLEPGTVYRYPMKRYLTTASVLVACDAVSFAWTAFPMA